MRAPGKDALLIALYVFAGLLLAWLTLSEFGHDKFEDCMSLRAFSKEQCEEYARE
ncbi:hypothetical protein [Methylocystis sp. S23]|jgi:hypothetical protein